MSPPPPRRIVVLGGGPAGLTAAHELTRLGVRPLVLEKRDKVGGLACTETFKGFHFDMGGHRFFTKAEEVKKLWHELLGPELLRRPRLSRIYFQGRFFSYPLRPLNALRGLGLWQAVLVVLSYVRWQLFAHAREDTFEQWVTNRFGRRLFAIFFKTYTEKVWGISCSELRAEWAAQRIKDLSLKTAVLSMFVTSKKTIRTLIEEFDYPRLGPGMMWKAMSAEVERGGGRVRLNAEVTAVHRTGRRVDALTVTDGERQERIDGGAFISSMPIREFIEKMVPPPPVEVLEAARQLVYRDFLTVCLIVDRPDLFPDNWIYVHSGDVKVARIQNFGNWSPDMVPEPGKTGIGLEYFCTEGDELWTATDAELIDLATRELDRLGLVRAADVEDGCVFRVPKAYPVYDARYRDHLATVREFVDGLENVQTVGRNGLHRYNNQDHAMLTGIRAARNVMLNERNDLWSVNTDQEYHEVQLEELLVPDGELEPVLVATFGKLDRLALGFAVGSVAAVVLFVATLVLAARGGDLVGPHLGLLGQFLPGYSVSVPGSVLGLAYGFASGFIAGWGFAILRNIVLWLVVAVVRRRAERQVLRRFLEFV